MLRSTPWMIPVCYHRMRCDTDDWDVYDCELDDQPASILVNLSAIARAPAPDKPWLLRISAHPPAARVAAPYGAERLAELCALRALLARVLTKGPPAEIVGGITSCARRELYYYATSTEGFEKTVEKMRARLSQYSIECRSERDPHWKQYCEVLFPSEVEMMQQIRSRRVLEQLQRNGDDHAVSRPVDHDFYFRTALDSTRFVGAASDLGFQVRSGPRQQMQGRHERPFFVNLVRSDPVTSDYITRIVAELLLLAARFDGQYDGWGCGVRNTGLETTHSRTARSIKSH
jgi:uncharacterized protein (TIGR01619 family)